MRVSRFSHFRSGLVVVALVVASTVTASPAHAASIAATPVATNLASPAAFTFAPDGRIFYGERFSGQVRVLNPTTGTSSLFFSVTRLATTGEQGLLGIAVHPNYPTAPYVYVYATRTISGVAENQILRLTDSAGVGSAMKVLYRAPATTNHNGGRILFGPSRMLFAVVGDANDPANSQNLTSTRGKVLRMNASGGVPDTNPFGNLVWAYGIRNSYGFAFDPETNRLWASENGPSCNDELNRIVKGANHGWGPSQTCVSPPAPPVNTNQDGPSPVLPKRFYTPTTAPTGVAFCSGCGLGAGKEGHLFYGTYKTGQIREVTLNTSRFGVAAEALAYSHSSGVLSVESAPDGRVYFSDGSGIYRLSLT